MQAIFIDKSRTKSGYIDVFPFSLYIDNNLPAHPFVFACQNLGSETSAKALTKKNCNCFPDDAQVRHDGLMKNTVKRTLF
jgi:hypothetical protein